MFSPLPRVFTAYKWLIFGNSGLPIVYISLETIFDYFFKKMRAIGFLSFGDIEHSQKRRDFQIVMVFVMMVSNPSTGLIKVLFLSCPTTCHAF
jgi:hypothetical protein